MSTLIEQATIGILNPHISYEEQIITYPAKVDTVRKIRKNNTVSFFALFVCTVMNNLKDNDI